MERTDLYEATKKELPTGRWEHSLRVVETAIILAENVGVSPQQAEIAGILHDYCKYWPEKELRCWMDKSKQPKTYYEYPKIWHAFVGAEIAHFRFSVQDEHILNAIRYHTSGRPSMSLLEKVIYLADYIEPKRAFPGVDEVRSLAKENIDYAVLKALDNTIISLIERRENVFPLTLEARNDLLRHISLSKKEDST